MKVWSERTRARYKAQKIGLAATVLLASVRVVAAQEQHTPPQYGSYQNPHPCTSLADCDRKSYDEFGNAWPNGFRSRSGASRRARQCVGAELRRRDPGPRKASANVLQMG